MSAPPREPAAAPPPLFDRREAAGDAERLLRTLLCIDTRHPPHGELPAARALAAAFAGVPRVETALLEMGDGRGNALVRLRARRATRRPVLVMGHLDVVDVDPARWTVPPFAPTVREGYLYGRGAIDDKGPLAAAAAALRQLARRDDLDRDVLLLATAGEETGGDGIRWVLEHEPAVLADVEMALNEGGRVRVRNGTIATVLIQTTEKVPCNVTLTARGPAGHAMVPLAGNALVTLARAVARLHEWRPAARLTGTTRLYFRRLATREQDPGMRTAMEEVSDPSASAARVEDAAAVLSREPLHAVMLRSTLSVTQLAGGFQRNVIPSEGTANLNVRLVPGDDVNDMLAALAGVAAGAGGEPVSLHLAGPPPPSPPPSPVTTPLFRAMEDAARALAPDALVLPFLPPGATDGAYLRARGIPTYGILPFPLTAEDESRFHGDDERVPLAALAWGAEYVYRVLVRVAVP